MLADVFIVHELGALLTTIVRTQCIGQLGQRGVNVGSRQLAAPPSLGRKPCGVKMATQPSMLPEELVSNLGWLHDLASSASSVPLRRNADRNTVTVGRYASRAHCAASHAISRA